MTTFNVARQCKTTVCGHFDRVVCFGSVTPPVTDLAVEHYEEYVAIGSRNVSKDPRTKVRPRSVSVSSKSYITVVFSCGQASQTSSKSPRM